MSAPHGTGVEEGALCQVSGHCHCREGSVCCWCGDQAVTVDDVELPEGGRPFVCACDEAGGDPDDCVCCGGCYCHESFEEPLGDG